MDPNDLHRVGRKEIRELGMTLVIGARRKPPPVHLYRALLMAQVASSKHEHTRQGQQHTHTDTRVQDQQMVLTQISESAVQCLTLQSYKEINSRVWQEVESLLHFPDIKTLEHVLSKKINK